MKDLKAFLTKVPPFLKLPASDLDRVLSAVQVVKQKKGEIIFSEGDDASSVWILTEGRLEIFKYTSDGRPRAIELINPGDIYGTLCRMGSVSTCYPCTAIASVDSESIRMPDSVFLDLFHRVPSVVSGVCALCSNRLVQMQDLTCASQEPVEKRIVQTLFKLSATHGNTLPYTKREISELAATTVETTIRTLSEFQKKKWISSSRGKIVLNSPAELQKLI